MQVLDAVVPGTAKNFLKMNFSAKWASRIIVGGLTLAACQNLVGAQARHHAICSKWAPWSSTTVNGTEQLIPAAFVAKATSKIARSRDDDNFADTAHVSGTAYGYFRWQADLSTGDKSYLSKAARGGGGQYIIVIDALDLVVVVTAHNRNIDDDTLSLTATRILQTFIK